MKNLVKGMLMLSVLFTSSATFAQGQAPEKSPQERAWAQSQWMKSDLSLNNEQNQRVFQVLFKYDNQAQALKSSPAGGEKRSKMMEIKKSENAELKEILSNDQFQKYQTELKEKMKAHQGSAQE